MTGRNGRHSVGFDLQRLGFLAQVSGKCMWKIARQVY